MSDKKRLFQIFDEMNVNDEKNKTALLPCSFTMVAANSDKHGGLVTMGVEAHILQKIFVGDMQPILVVMDKKEYYRLESIPLTDKHAQRIEQLEKALEQIRDLTPYSSLTGDQRSETMVEIATEALKKQ